MTFSGVDFASTGTGTSTSEYRRIGGTAILRTGSTTVQVDFNAVADNREVEAVSCTAPA
jgi:hypothetical protein